MPIFGQIIMLCMKAYMNGVSMSWDVGVLCHVKIVALGCCVGALKHSHIYTGLNILSRFLGTLITLFVRLLHELP